MELLSKKFESVMRQILNNQHITLLTTIPVQSGRPIPLVEQVRTHPQCLVVQVSVNIRIFIDFF